MKRTLNLQLKQITRIAIASVLVTSMNAHAGLIAASAPTATAAIVISIVRVGAMAARATVAATVVATPVLAVAKSKDGKSSPDGGSGKGGRRGDKANGSGNETPGNIEGERSRPSDGYGPRLDEGGSSNGAGPSFLSTAVDKTKNYLNGLSTSQKVILGGTLVLGNDENQNGAVDIAADTAALQDLELIDSTDSAAIVSDLTRLASATGEARITIQELQSAAREASEKNVSTAEVLAARLSVANATAEYILNRLVIVQ